MVVIKCSDAIKDPGVKYMVLYVVDYTRKIMDLYFLGQEQTQMPI